MRSLARLWRVKTQSIINTTQNCYFKLGWRSRELEEIYKRRSQIAGWTLMLTALLILFVSVSIRRCIRRRQHLRLPNIEYYYHVEAKEALEKFHAKAKEMVKENQTGRFASYLRILENDQMLFLVLHELPLKLRRSMDSFPLHYPKVILFFRLTIPIEMEALSSQHLLGLVPRTKMSS